MNVIIIIAVYFIALNLIGFLLMGIDKRRAIKHAWRIPESTFFVVAVIGGSIGTILGMRVFHHKTKHWYFVIGMPLILLLELLALFLLYKSPIQITIM